MSTHNFYNFINGEFTPALSGHTLTKFNPFNGEALGEVSASESMDVVQAIQGAKKAFAEFESWSLAQRADLLRKIATELERKQEEYAYQEALHQGLPASFVKEKSVVAAAAYFQEAADLLEQIQTRSEASVQYQPTGLISIIVSWNLSLRLVCERLAAALAAGNACLVKVSEFSPVTAQILGEVLTVVRAPKGLVQLLQGRGEDLGLLLASHPSIRGVSFVGQLANAEKIQKGAAALFKKIQIGSGVKNSLMILSNVNYDKLMPQIMESFMIGQGQLGWNISRLFILESMQKDFLKRLTDFLENQSPATSPNDTTTLWYPLIKKTPQRFSSPELSFRGLETGPGYFFRPKVMLDLSNCSELQQDEILGPLLIVSVVKYQHEMVKWSNTGYYGHSAVIWGDSDKALKVAEKLRVGTVSCNSWLPQKMSLGQGQSSFGNMDKNPFGTFYSDVKVLTGF